MNPAEIYELQSNAVSLMDGSFQFWLSASFAVILATHFARESITKLVRRLLATLYLASAALVLVRILHVGYQFYQYNARLVVAGLDPFPSHPVAEVLISAGTLTIITLGTAGTLYYMVRSIPGTTASRSVD